MACKAFRNLEPNPVAYKLNMLKKMLQVLATNKNNK